MKKVITWIIILATIAGSVASVLWYRRQQAEIAATPEILRTTNVIQGNLVLSVPASGSVAVQEKRDLFFSRPGTVTHIAVPENARVTAGQTLAQLDSTDLERALRNAEIALEQAELNLKQLHKPVADADLELARLSVQSAAQSLEAARLSKITVQSDADAMVVQAERNRENAFKDYHAALDTPAADPLYDKYEDALEQETIANLNAELTIKQVEDQWLSAYNFSQQAQRSLARLEQGPDAIQTQQSELQITQARLNLEQAQRNLTSAALTAPIDGLIATRNVQLGLAAPTQQAAFTLVADDEFYVDVMVDEMDIGKIQITQIASVNLDAYPDTPLTGTVATIAPAPTNVGGIVSYKVRVLLTEMGKTQVREKMTANVIIYTGEVSELTLIPNWAIRTDQSDNSIYTYQLNGAQIARVTLTLGPHNDTHTAILTGLEPGMTVALITADRTLPGPEHP